MNVLLSWIRFFFNRLFFCPCCWVIGFKPTAESVLFLYVGVLTAQLSRFICFSILCLGILDIKKLAVNFTENVGRNSNIFHFNLYIVLFLHTLWLFSDSVLNNDKHS